MCIDNSIASVASALYAKHCVLQRDEAVLHYKKPCSRKMAQSIFFLFHRWIELEILYQKKHLRRYVVLARFELERFENIRTLQRGDGGY